jgi:hypothetical protein
VKPQADSTVFVLLGLRSKDLAILRSKVGGLVSVELDLRTEVDELELVQPARMYLDVETE